MFTNRYCVAAVLVGGLACAAGPSSSGTQATPAATSKDSDVITAAELADPSISSSDALTAIRQLRRRFLASRGSASLRDSSAGRVHMSLNGGSLEPVDNLSRIRVAEIKEIRFLSASDAALRFGAKAGSGAVILLTSK